MSAEEALAILSAMQSQCPKDIRAFICIAAPSHSEPERVMYHVQENFDAETLKDFVTTVVRESLNDLELKSPLISDVHEA